MEPARTGRPKEPRAALGGHAGRRRTHTEAPTTRKRRRAQSTHPRPWPPIAGRGDDADLPWPGALARQNRAPEGRAHQRRGGHERPTGRQGPGRRGERGGDESRRGGHTTETDGAREGADCADREAGARIGPPLSRTKSATDWALQGRRGKRAREKGGPRAATAAGGAGRQRPRGDQLDGGKKDRTVTILFQQRLTGGGHLCKITVG